MGQTLSYVNPARNPTPPWRNQRYPDHVMADEDLKAELDRLRAENEALKKPGRGQLSVRVSEKGAVSVYGLGRFPVTLYKEQWEKLLAAADQIKTFVKENDHLLKKKEQ
ncbi:MAG: hypothetical protein ABSH32_04140 [Bryobacteraceae bacterium]